jgi:hypothetical protein
MWLVRAYSNDDELATEEQLGELTQGELGQRLGFAPTKLGSTPLDSSALVGLADMLRLPVDDRLDYFLDYDADQKPASQKSSALRASA